MNLLFIHGFMGSALNWGSVRSKIEEIAKESAFDLKTHAVDLLGHASKRASRDLNNYSSAHDALTHELFLDIKDIGPLVAVGHSFGLRPLLLLTKQKPELIETLIVEDSSPELSEQSCAFLFNILRKTPTPFRTRELARDHFNSRFTPELARFLLSNIKSFDNGNLNDWRFDRPFLEKLLEEAQTQPLWDEWQHFKGKTFLMTGEKSALFTNPDVLQKIQNFRAPHRLPHFVIKDSGHWIHSDKKDEFCDTLFQILNLI